MAWTSAAPCNWLLPDNDEARGKPFCRSCRLDRTVPDPADRDNAELWLKVELAKRALVIHAVLPIGGGKRLACMGVQEREFPRHRHRGSCSR